MQVTYQLTSKDFRRGIFAYYSKNPIIRIFVAMATLVIGAAILLWLSGGDRNIIQNLLPLCIIFGTYLALILMLPFYSGRRQFAGTPSAKLPINLEVSESGLHFKSENIDSTTSWRTFAKWREGKAVFVLFTSPYVFHIVPKRAFATGQADEFREMLRQNIPDKR